MSKDIIITPGDTTKGICFTDSACTNFIVSNTCGGNLSLGGGLTLGNMSNPGNSSNMGKLWVDSSNRLNYNTPSNLGNSTTVVEEARHGRCILYDCTLAADCAWFYMECAGAPIDMYKCSFVKLGFHFCGRYAGAPQHSGHTGAYPLLLINEMNQPANPQTTFGSDQHLTTCCKCSDREASSLGRPSSGNIAGNDEYQRYRQAWDVTTANKFSNGQAYIPLTIFDQGTGSYMSYNHCYTTGQCAHAKCWGVYGGLSITGDIYMPRIYMDGACQYVNNYTGAVIRVNGVSNGCVTSICTGSSNFSGGAQYYHNNTRAANGIYTNGCQHAYAIANDWNASGQPASHGNYSHVLRYYNVYITGVDSYGAITSYNIDLNTHPEWNDFVSGEWLYIAQDGSYDHPQVSWDFHVGNPHSYAVNTSGWGGGVYNGQGNASMTWWQFNYPPQNICALRNTPRKKDQSIRNIRFALCDPAAHSQRFAQGSRLVIYALHSCKLVAHAGGTIT